MNHAVLSTSSIDEISRGANRARHDFNQGFRSVFITLEKNVREHFSVRHEHLEHLDINLNLDNDLTRAPYKPIKIYTV